MPEASDGRIKIENLAQGTDSSFNLNYDLGNGQKITIGKLAISISSSGGVSLTSTLIDPYGIIRDPATGKAISGAKVTLFYADTERNKASGKTPQTAVSLPTIEGFEPSNNANPQVNDAYGAYAFMTFPYTDYYIEAVKDGYEVYKSPVISVEEEIIKWDFKMNRPQSGVTRFAGPTRVDTALEIAKASYAGQLDAVVLATADNYPDALAGSVLAYKLNAPILLVGSSAQEQAKVLEYIKDNLDPAGTVYILGGPGVVGGSMEVKVRTSGFGNIIRLYGADRYETAVKIADKLGVNTGTPVVLVSGENYPDALTMSSIAAVMQKPILLVQKDRISDAVKQEIARIKPSKVYIIGSNGAVNAEVEDEVARIISADKANIVRIGGTNRYETSLAAVRHFNLTGKIVCVSTGNNFPDALAGSIYAANYNAPIILVDGSLSDKARNYLETRKITGVAIFGGEGAVSKDSEEELGQLISSS